MSERKIVEYKIISTANHYVGLTELVNQEIKEGWQPQGGVSNDGVDWEQAMVKYE